MWEGQGFWITEDPAQSITFLDLLAVANLLHRHFCNYVSTPHVLRILLPEYNQSVLFVLNAMFSASNPIMAEFSKL